MSQLAARSPSIAARSPSIVARSHSTPFNRSRPSSGTLSSDPSRSSSRCAGRAATTPEQPVWRLAAERLSTPRPWLRKFQREPALRNEPRWETSQENSPLPGINGTVEEIVVREVDYIQHGHDLQALRQCQIRRPTSGRPLPPVSPSDKTHSEHSVASDQSQIHASQEVQTPARRRARRSSSLGDLRRSPSAHSMLGTNCARPREGSRCDRKVNFSGQSRCGHARLLNSHSESKL